MIKNGVTIHNWGKNPRLDKTIKRVIQMCKYVEKDIKAAKQFDALELIPVASSGRTLDICYDR